MQNYGNEDVIYCVYVHVVKTICRLNLSVIPSRNMMPSSVCSQFARMRLFFFYFSTQLNNAGITMKWDDF